MNNRREEYLDLILNILLEDSIIERINKSWYLTSPWIKNDNRNYPNLGLFHTILPYTLNSAQSSPFGIYCRDNYGLTDQEIYDMWRIYHGEMWKRYYNKSNINESVDNKKIYLDKIIKWFVDDTIIIYEKGIIIYPFSPIGPMGKPLPSFIDDLKTKLSWGMSSDIQITCRDTYGLNYDETKYIWDNYKTIIKGRYNKESIMYDLKPINESVDRKKEFLDKVVEYLVADTMVDQKNKVWYPPFPTDHDKPTFNHFYGLIPMTDHLGLKFLIGNSYVRNFFNYCKDTYGLTDDKEIRKVWERYLKDLTPKIDGYSIINGIPTINESVDRKKEFLDKIVNYLVDDTKIEVVSNKWNPPFMTIWLERSRLFSHDVPHAGIFYRFYEYCKETYGLSDDEMMGVWNKYTKSLIYKLRDS